MAIIKSPHSFEESVFSCCSSIQLTKSKQGFGFSLKRIQNCTNLCCSPAGWWNDVTSNKANVGTLIFYITHRLNRLRRCEHSMIYLLLYEDITQSPGTPKTLEYKLVHLNKKSAKQPRTVTSHCDDEPAKWNAAIINFSELSEVTSLW